MINNPIKPEQLLAEIEDLLKSAPSMDELQTAPGSDKNISWLGRAEAVVKQWDFGEYLRLNVAQGNISTGLRPTPGIPNKDTVGEFLWTTVNH